MVRTKESKTVGGGEHEEKGDMGATVDHTVKEANSSES